MSVELRGMPVVDHLHPVDQRERIIFHTTGNPDSHLSMEL